MEPALVLLRQRYFGGAMAARPWSERQWLRAAGAGLAERLGPALAEAAEALGVKLPPPAWAALTAARLRNERVLAAQGAALAEMSRDLRERGLTAVPFKGLALARHYPASGVRESADIDLLVPPRELDAVQALLLEAGYRRWAGGGELSSRYALSFQRHGGTPEGDTAVDLHPSWHELEVSEDGKAVRVGERVEALVRQQIAGVEWAALPPHVELYLTAAHAILHGNRTLSVYLDVAVLLEQLGSRHVVAARDLARSSGRERHLRHALIAAAELFEVEATPPARGWPSRLGVPLSLRVGYVGSRWRFLPSSLLMELALRRGLRRKCEFVRWVLGHHGGSGQKVGGVRRWRDRLRSLRWLGGTLIRYRIPRPAVAGPERRRV